MVTAAMTFHAAMPLQLMGSDEKQYSLIVWYVVRVKCKPDFLWIGIERMAVSNLVDGLFCVKYVAAQAVKGSDARLNPRLGGWAIEC